MSKFAWILSVFALAASCAHNEPIGIGELPSGDSSSAETSILPPAAGLINPAESKRNDSTLHPRGIDFGATIRIVAFGSSANQDLPQPIWKAIAENKPDLFLFMGDNVQTSKPEQKALMAQYRKLDEIPGYRGLREKVPFMATWDDQDFGHKEFLQYWTYVANSISFGQRGIYHAKIIGPKRKQVQVIMLDTRTFRTVSSDPDSTILGGAQWDWLEEQLKRSAQVRFVVSSIPLIASDFEGDKWANFPRERQRFFDLLKKTRARNVIVVSGDRHQSSIAKTGIKGWGVLFDVTASPINVPLPNAVEDASYEGKAFAQESFGMAHIDWNKRRLSLQIQDINNKPVNSATFNIK